MVEPRYTRVAIAQVPRDLVGRHFPDAVRQLNLDLELATDDPGVSLLLQRLRGTLQTLVDSLRRMADAQEYSYISSLLSFCGQHGRGVDVLVLPEISPPGAWQDGIRQLCYEHGIPLLILGSHHFGCAYRQNGPDFHLPVDPPVVVRVRSWSELPMAVPAQRVGPRTVYTVPTELSTQDLVPRVEASALALRRAGFATAVANSGGHTRFYVRSTVDGRDDREVTDDRPLGPLPYRIPEGNAAVSILDIDLGNQADTAAIPPRRSSRLVTMAPLIPEELFPTYCQYLGDLERASHHSDIIVRSDSARRARRATLRVLEHFEGDGHSEFASFKQKIVQAEEACDRDDGIALLLESSEPEDVKRLVDAVVMPRADGCIEALTISTCGMLRELVQRLSPKETPPLLALIDRLESLGKRLEGSRKWLAPGVISYDDAPPRVIVDERPMATQRRVLSEADLLAFEDLVGDALARLDPELRQASDAGKLLKRFEVLLQEILVEGRLSSESLETAQLSLLHARRTPDQDDLGSKGAATVEAMVARQLSTLENLQKVDLLLSWVDSMGVPLDLQAISSELATTDKSHRETEILERVDSLARNVMNRPVSRREPQHPAAGLSGGRSPITRDLVRRRSHAIHLALQDEVPSILRGLLLELEVIHIQLRIGYRESLRNLASLTKTQREDRIESHRHEIRRVLPLLGDAVRALLADPREHWTDVPRIFGLMRSLMELMHETLVLAQLTALLPPEVP